MFSWITGKLAAVLGCSKNIEWRKLLVFMFNCRLSSFSPWAYSPSLWVAHVSRSVLQLRAGGNVGYAKISFALKSALEKAPFQELTISAKFVRIHISLRSGYERSAI